MPWPLCRSLINMATHVLGVILLVAVLYYLGMVWFCLALLPVTLAVQRLRAWSDRW